MRGKRTLAFKIIVLLGPLGTAFWLSGRRNATRPNVTDGEEPRDDPAIGWREDGSRPSVDYTGKWVDVVGDRIVGSEASVAAGVAEARGKGHDEPDLVPVMPTPLVST